MNLNAEQSAALTILQGEENVFLTGAAGSGKSTLLKHFLARRTSVPVLASTGAAAILVGGRTFHSFFGLGIMEGGVEATVQRARKHGLVMSRLRKAHAVVIDEISMISGEMLRAAESIARHARDSSAPWGGLRVIAVGDFAQLPPVNPFQREKDWAFASEAWRVSDFRPIVLREIMRATDAEFLAALNEVRVGRISSATKKFLDARTRGFPMGEFTRLLAHREAVEKYNLEKLAGIDSPLMTFKTEYQGKEKDIETFRKHAPIPEEISLKEGALVMLRQNDVDGRWVNGSLGHVVDIGKDELEIALLSGSAVKVPRAEFTLLNADGQPVVVAKNFPLSLAWAMTIHKAQGATLDRMWVDLRRAWEPGQAYVALSRARDPKEVFIEGWAERSIFADRDVEAFHASLREGPREVKARPVPGPAEASQLEIKF